MLSRVFGLIAMDSHTKASVVKTRLNGRAANTRIERVSYEGGGRYRLDIPKNGGFSFSLNADDKYAVRHMVSSEASDTVSVYIAEKR